MDGLRRGFLQTALGAGISASMFEWQVSAESPTEPEGSLTLAASMDLAGQHLLGSLNPYKHNLPYWNLRIAKDYHAAWASYWPAHNIGRWLDALFRLEAATGFRIPPTLEQSMRKNAAVFFDNPDHLCFVPDGYAGDVQPSGQVELHSLREGLLALYALARFRKDSWAVSEAHKMLETVWNISRPDGGWELEKLEAYRRLRKQAPKHMDPTATNGRLIEALVWFYHQTGDPLAMRLADRFARYHLASTTHSDGTLNLDSRADHTHSYLGTLRGLLLFGETTNQHEYIDRVAATYRQTILKRLIKHSGYIAHDLTTEGTAEPTSVGDIVQLGLWLSRHGYPELLDDCEWLVRCRLLPCQITKPPDLIPEADDADDQHKNLGARAAGAYGGMHKPQWGKHPVTDITCAVLHSLADVYQHVAVRNPAGLTVNFHLTYEDRNIRITSRRGKEAAVTIEPQVCENLLVRIPRWTPIESVRLSLNGTPFKFTSIGNFAFVPREMLPAKILLQYGLPVRTEVEQTAGVKYTFRWRGDEILGVTPNNDFFPFYPTLQKG